MNSQNTLMSLVEKSLIRRDRTIILWTVLAVVVLAWGVMWNQARGMEHMNPHMAMCSMPRASSWNPADMFFLFGMWTVMMTAMMLPAVIPTTLLFTMVNRQRKESQNPFVPTWIFLSGYLAVWTVFSCLAAFLQMYLHKKILLSPLMVSTSSSLSGLLFIFAGVYQFTSLKEVCLRHCQTPLNFLMTSWREGKVGAFFMGLQHGMYCSGCCWILMMLLFALGVMNIWGILFLSLFVLIEKNFSIKNIPGILLIIWGIFVFFTP